MALRQQRSMKWRERLPSLDDSSSSCSSDGFGDENDDWRRGNLDRFLQATCPSVPKRCPWEEAPLPYFVLGDLWDSFDEWSAYGAGVPITLSAGQDSVVQYYVPYLSAIQLYTLPRKKKPCVKFRRAGEDSDGSDRDWSSDYESDRPTNCCSSSSTCSISSTTSSRGNALFEYLEVLPPHARVPLTDKIASLARGAPELRYLTSAQLLPASWVSIAWYPIYRIPNGQTLRDLQACFLTFHCLSTSLQDGPHSGIVEPGSSCHLSWPSSFSTSDAAKIKLGAFGLAHYKLRGSIWMSNGNMEEQRRTASLVECAEVWLRCLNVKHPDFEFFQRH